MSLKPKCPDGYILSKKGCLCRKRKNCPKGTRKNKETGECQPKNKQKELFKKNLSKKNKKKGKTPGTNLFTNNTIKLSKTKKNFLKRSQNTKKISKKLKMPTITKPIFSKTNLTKTNKSLNSKTLTKSIFRTGKRCPKGYKWNPVTRECDPKGKTKKMLSTIFSIPDNESKLETNRNTKSKTITSKTRKSKKNTMSKTEKATKKIKKSAIRKSKTLAVTKTRTNVTKSRMLELSKTLKKEYSPTINQKIQSLISKSPHRDLFVNVDCNLLEITIVTESGKELCYDWKSKQAQEYMLDNLRSTKKIVPRHIIGPAQTDNNCWMNTFFAIFFLSDKGRKFLRFFREAMITGKLQTKNKVKKFNKNIHEAFWILNRFITASLLGTQDIGEYAKLIDTNDVVQGVYEALPKKYRYKPSGVAANPIQFYFSILRYLENFGHGSLIPFPLHTYRIFHDKEALDNLSQDIKSMEKIPHMIIVEIIDDPVEETYNVNEFEKPLTITSGKYQYELDAVAIRDVEKHHVCALITINGTDYKLDGEDFSPVRKLKWKNLINKNKSFKITKTIGEKYNFKKSYQALIYYRIQ